MTDLEELERLAKDSVEKRAGLHKARGVQTVARAQSASFEANCAFGNLASPRLILALLEERKRLREALESTRRIAALHMKARGFTLAQINESFPETDAALEGEKP